MQGVIPANQIRPPDVLAKSLKHVLGQYRKHNDYCYIKNQFRSIRQDLLLQSIRNEFNVIIVENNIRVCLENYDIVEYERLRVELEELYRDYPRCKNDEFVYASLIYLILNEDSLGLHKLFKEMKDDDLISDVV